MQDRLQLGDKVIVIDTGEIGTIIEIFKHQPYLATGYRVVFDVGVVSHTNEYSKQELMLVKGNSDSE